MKFAATSALLAFAASFSACAAPPDPPMVGGPCSYETKVIGAAVTAVDGAEIGLVDEDGVTFYQRAEAFRETVEVGQYYLFEKRYIVQGTCTPYSFLLIGPPPKAAVLEGGE